MEVSMHMVMFPHVILWWLNHMCFKVKVIGQSKVLNFKLGTARYLITVPCIALLMEILFIIKVLKKRKNPLINLKAAFVDLTCTLCTCTDNVRAMLYAINHVQFVGQGSAGLQLGLTPLKLHTQGVVHLDMAVLTASFLGCYFYTINPRRTYCCQHDFLKNH